MRSDFWFVHPYADDPAGDAEHAAAFTTSAHGWPPQLRATTAGPPAEPERRGLPGGSPPRPSDLRRIRRHHRVRVAAKGAATVAAAGGVVAAGWWAARVTPLRR